MLTFPLGKNVESAFDLCLKKLLSKSLRSLLLTEGHIASESQTISNTELKRAFSILVIEHYRAVIGNEF